MNSLKILHNFLNFPQTLLYFSNFPQKFPNFAHFLTYFSSALKGITLPETGALKKSASFIATFIKESRNHVNMTNTILVRGEEIIRTVLLCIAGITPRVNVDVFGDVLIAMNAKYPSEFIVWMKILEAPSFPTTYIGHEEKITFMKNIIK